MKYFLTLVFTISALPVISKTAQCDLKTTPISTIQGHESISPLVGQHVWVKGVVTGDFRGKDKLNGYFIQNVNADAPDNSSEGLFIHDIDPNLAIKSGDLLVLRGQVTEQFKVTQISQVEQTKVCQSNHQLPAPVALELPLGNTDLERYEGMRITFAKPYIITDIYQYLKYGELIVSSKMLFSPTAIHRPGPQVKQHVKLNKKDQLVIDDGRLSEYAQPFNQGSDASKSVSAENPIQVGQSIQTTGVMHFSFGKYKLQPTEPLQLEKQKTSKQTKPMLANSQLRVGTFNVENFFTTIDQGEDICGPLKNFGCRGADSEEEFKRQLDKLVAVINTSGASVLGIQELENNATQSIESLVTALNDSTENKNWAYIDTGLLGEDVIKVGIIYQADQVEPMGQFALLNQAADAEFLENKNRIVVAQTFTDNNNHSFNLATVHFKSKSCRDAEGIFLDQKDGQGCYNATRVQVAQQVATWLSKDPTGQGVKATFLVGDFNSYQQEDPMVVLKDQGFYNLADYYLDAENWTTSYRGTVGSLDYVLANQAAKAVSTGLTQWHINSISIKDFSYDTEPLSELVDKPAGFYQKDPFASSDHDLVLVNIAF
ncbi:MAG: ExeM/NucH family extracellular endonuclease [Marinicella sp.]